MVEKRVDDRAFIGLISRFLESGIKLPDGTTEFPENGTPQGGVISPVLANIYLHYVLDLWFEKKVKTQGQGKALMVRYADDFVAAFRYHGDAARFYRELGPRFAKFGLELAKEKTKKLQFNRFKKDCSETFVFLGYEFRQTVSMIKGNDIVTTTMSRKKLRSTVNAFAQWCREHRNKRIAWIMGMVKSKLAGISNYFNLPGNSGRLKEVTTLFQRKLFFWLNRRSERKSYNVKTFNVMWKQFLGKSLRSLANEGIQISFLSSLV